MVTLTLNKKRLLDDLRKIDVDVLLERMAMMGVEVEEHTQTEIIVDITPNRPDLLSQPGLTRALMSFLGIKPGLREYGVQKSKLKVKVDPAAKEIRPYTACAVATNLALDDERLRELIDIQEKLHVTFCRRRKRAAIGVYPMDAISGNITFTALPLEEIKFRPLEAAGIMSAKEILETHPKGKEYAHLIIKLPKYPVFLDAKNNVLSMPPVINSHETGKVTIATKEIFIEASGHDMRICEEIVRIMCCALFDMGATIQSVEISYGKRVERTPDLSTRKQQFLGYYINKRLGTSITKEQFPQLLSKMGLGFEDGRVQETHYALIPPYRVDFLHQADVVEDIAIAYGYDAIMSSLPTLATTARESETTLFKNTVRTVLASAGLLEAKNYHLLSSVYQRALDLQEPVLLKSSVSEEYDSLRTSLLACLLKTLSINRTHEYPQQFFELGTVFSSAKEGVVESQHLAIVLAGDADYTRSRQVVELLLRALGVTAVFQPVQDARFLAGRCAAIIVREKHIGVVGELAPQALSAAQVPVPTAGCEIDLDYLREGCG